MSSSRLTAFVCPVCGGVARRETPSLACFGSAVAVHQPALMRAEDPDETYPDTTDLNVGFVK